MESRFDPTLLNLEWASLSGSEDNKTSMHRSESDLSPTNPPKRDPFICSRGVVLFPQIARVFEGTLTTLEAKSLYTEGISRPSLALKTSVRPYIFSKWRIFIARPYLC